MIFLYHKSIKGLKYTKIIVNSAHILNNISKMQILMIVKAWLNVCIILIVHISFNNDNWYENSSI